MSDQEARAWEAFNHAALKRICEMRETEFGLAYDMVKVKVEEREPEDFYYFRDNGSDILAVAHLDTVVGHKQRLCNFIETAAGPIVYSGALDDRLGAYIILELLPALGINYDILLTVGEESGASTAAHFNPADHHDREYNWMIEFDRGGTDVVLYQYDDDPTAALVRACGAKVSEGIFSDISYMEHLGIKGFNWGVGYRDYHGPRSHAYLDDTMMMVGYYLDFHEANATVALPHEERYGRHDGWWRWGGNSFSDEKLRCDVCLRLAIDPETEWCEDCGICNVCFEDGLGDRCSCPWAISDRQERGIADYEEEHAEALREIEDVHLREGVL